MRPDATVRVLGIDVGDELLETWCDWLMPERQPYAVPRSLADSRGWADGRAALSFELLDSFELYGVGRNEAIVWLGRGEGRSLPEAVRRAQPAAHRWPSRDRARDRARVIRRVERGRRASRHGELGAYWSEVSEVLPGAAAIAGTFPERSGPNCFGAVMGAAGVAGSAGAWVQLDEFEDWLAAEAAPSARGDGLGVVYVWRTGDGEAAHAAVGLGRGWLLHKPSQGWMSPTKVLTVQEGKHSARQVGLHLSRYRLTRS